MLIIIDTTGNEELLSQLDRISTEHELIRAAELDINPCIGCNYCWLKTPGVCSVKDDYEEVFKKMVKADQIWIVSNTALGFVTPKAKNIVDRMIPIATMYLKFEGKQMRHVLRYKRYDFGLIYDGEADKGFMKHWSERVAINCGGKSKGAFEASEIGEALACMY